MSELRVRREQDTYNDGCKQSGAADFVTGTERPHLNESLRTCTQLAQLTPMERKRESERGAGG